MSSRRLSARPKLGIDLFAEKSEIAEGCSDFREIGDSSDLPGISDVRLSKSYGSELLVRLRRHPGRLRLGPQYWPFGGVKHGAWASVGMHESVVLYSHVHQWS